MSLQTARTAAKTMSLWDSVRDSLQKTAEKAGNVAMIAGQKTKLNAEYLYVDREITLRKQAFGVELYDYVAPLSSKPEFYASDDKQTDTLRPHLLRAQREIAALEIRKGKIKEQQAQAEITRRAAFPTPAQSLGGKMLNAGKSSVLAANEAKLMTDSSTTQRLITAQKEAFGEQLFDTLVELEDKEGWLPTDRDLRSIYDQARRDVEKLLAKKAAKEQELKALDDPNAAASSSNQNASQPAVYNTPTVPGSVGVTATGTAMSHSYGGGGMSSSFQSSTTQAAVTQAPASYGSTQASSYGAPQATTASVVPDPFASSAPAAAASSYGAAPQQSKPDPFAANTAPNSFPNTTSYAPPAPAPTNDLFAGMNSGFPPAPASAAPAADPFANAAGYSAPTPAPDPFAGMTLSATPVDPFAPTQTNNNNNNNNDPFAGLSGGASSNNNAPADPFAGTIFAGTSQGSTNNNNASQFGSGMRR